MMSDKKSLGGPLIIATVSLVIFLSFLDDETVLTRFFKLASASAVSALVSAHAFFHVKLFSTLLGNSDVSGLLASIGVSKLISKPYYGDVLLSRWFLGVEWHRRDM